MDDLLIADVLGVEADRSFHCKQGQYLQQVVLHYVPDDPVVVEVAAARRKSLSVGLIV